MVLCSRLQVCAPLNPKHSDNRFMKLRLDRVLKLELTGLSRQEVFQSGGPVPDFTPPEKWTAPYSPYRKGAFVASPLASRAAILRFYTEQRVRCTGPSIDFIRLAACCEAGGLK